MIARVACADKGVRQCPLPLLCSSRLVPLWAEQVSPRVLVA